VMRVKGTWEQRRKQSLTYSEVGPAAAAAERLQQVPEAGR
jgi:hypothetical protein